MDQWSVTDLFVNQRCRAERDGDFPPRVQGSVLSSQGFGGDGPIFPDPGPDQMVMHNYLGEFITWISVPGIGPGSRCFPEAPNEALMAELCQSLAADGQIGGGGVGNDVLEVHQATSRKTSASRRREKAT